MGRNLQVILMTRYSLCSNLSSTKLYNLQINWHFVVFLSCLFFVIGLLESESEPLLFFTYTLHLYYKTWECCKCIPLLTLLVKFHKWKYKKGKYMCVNFSRRWKQPKSFWIKLQKVLQYKMLWWKWKKDCSNCKNFK